MIRRKCCSKNLVWKGGSYKNIFAGGVLIFKKGVRNISEKGDLTRKGWRQGIDRGVEEGSFNTEEIIISIIL